MLSDIRLPGVKKICFRQSNIIKMKDMKLKLRIIGISVLILSLQLSAVAQDDKKAVQPIDKKAVHEDLASKSQNPIGDLISVPFQFNFNLGTGPDNDRMQTVINMQPVLPVKLGKKWSMINRMILPFLIVQPDYTTESDNIVGMGSLNYSAFFVPGPIGKKKKVEIGIGPAMIIPTNTSNSLGDGQFAIGPSMVLFSGHKHWTYGFVAQNTWAFNSPTGAPLYNSFLLQYFVNYNFQHGWSVGTGPIITVDWTAEEGEKAVVPFGLAGSKISHIGKQAVKYFLAYNYNVIRPTYGAKGGQIQFTFILLFPKK
jgi:hypothetical protein